MLRRVLMMLAGVLVLGALGAGSALGAAPEAPEVVVEQPVHASVAVVHGVLNPLAVAPGEAGTYEFLFKEGGSCEGGGKAPEPAGLAFGFEREEVAETLSGLTPGAEYSVCLRAEDAGGATVGPAVTFTTALTPEAPVTASPAKSITASSALFEGVLNPGAVGNAGSYEFIYRESASECQGEGQQTTGVVGASGEKEEAVQGEASGLLPDATYAFCLLARNEAGEEAVGPVVSFTTLAVAPSLDAASAGNLTSSSAELTARVDPNGADTAYRFEYGATSAYGASVPIPTGDAGAGRSDVVVSQLVGGLSANTTYHWRVVASSTGGTVTGSDHTFVYSTAGAGLPDGRAYEMVTPPHKNGAQIGNLFTGLNPEFAEDGSRFILSSVQCLDGAVSCPGLRQRAGTPFAFSRTSGGWVTTPLAPPATQFNSNAGLLFNAESGMALFSAPTPPAGEDDFYARRTDGSFVDVGPVYPPSFGELGSPNVAYSQIGSNNQATWATADLSHVVFEGEGGFWPFDATHPPSPSGSPPSHSLLEYVGSGNAAPVLVGVSGGPVSTDLISACSTWLAGNTSSGASALSVDGRTVYFTAERCASGSGANAGVEVPANELYARIDQARTVLVSGRSPLDCTGVCLSSPAGDAMLEGASADGSKAFFTSTQQLIDSASEDAGDSAGGIGTTRCPFTGGVNGCNLYEYNFASPAGHNLLAVSACEVAGCEPRVQGAMAISRDGSHAYFVAKGILTSRANSRGQVAQDGADNLYVFERDTSHPAGRVSFIATLPGEEAREWREGGAYEANVTPDGRFLVFRSAGLLTADDTRVDGALQVFRYDALSGGLVRISVGENGFNDDGNAGVSDARILRAFLGFGIAGAWRSDPSMSDDGAFVFFQSPVGLTPGALNDVQIDPNRRNTAGELLPPVYAANVYEWHEGHVYLISDGRDTSAAPLRGSSGAGFSSVELLGASASGRDVFFSTADRLVAQDTDTEADLYDARVCTASEPCLAPPPPEQAPCLGEGCHGVPGAPPLFGAPASAVFSGAGNLAPPQATPVVKAKKKPRKPGKPRKKPNKRHRGRGASRAGKRVKRGRR
jgi:hypothetical protein